MDGRGAFLDDRQDWFVVGVIRTRDSGCLEESNFQAAEERLGKVGECGEDWENHRFGHWGPGWFEILLVRPGSACEAEGKAIEDALEGYPVLDEVDLSQREIQLAEETWSNMSIGDRVEAIQEHGDGGIFAARREYLPNDPSGSLHEYLTRA